MFALCSFIKSLAATADTVPLITRLVGTRMSDGGHSVCLEGLTVQVIGAWRGYILVLLFVISCDEVSSMMLDPFQFFLVLEATAAAAEEEVEEEIE